jgi:HAD superfamily hydrolase (TIGR01509 family)
MSDSVAVIFDLDGVIVDTIGRLFDNYIRILSGLGAAGSHEEFNRLNGSNLDEIADVLIQNHDLASSPAAIREMFLQGFRQLYDDVELVTGIVPALQALHERGVTIGLASSAGRESIAFVLRRLGIDSYFQFFVSGDDVKYAKPDPAIYQLAKSQVNCRTYFAVEDSENGIRSAAAAGLIPIHFDPDRIGRYDFASYAVNELEEIVEIITELSAIVVCRPRQMALQVIEEPIQLASDELQVVEEVWQRETRKNSMLFDGGIVVYQEHHLSNERTLSLSCARSSYKFILAQLKFPKLSLVQPLGVSGIITDMDGSVLLGCRSQEVTEYPGFWEFVPSGGLSIESMTAHDYLDQIKCELIEETGLTPDNVCKFELFGFIYDQAHHVYDICVRLSLADRLDVMGLVSEEYSTFAVCSLDEVRELLRQDKVVPASVALFAALTQ